MKVNNHNVRRLNVEISPFKTLTRASGSCYHFPGFPGGASDKEHARQHNRCKRLGLSPWVRKMPWRREWQCTLHYSCLENPTDGGAWRATVYRVVKSRTWLSNWTAAAAPGLVLETGNALWDRTLHLPFRSSLGVEKSSRWLSAGAERQAYERERQIEGSLQGRHTAHGIWLCSLVYVEIFQEEGKRKDIPSIEYGPRLRGMWQSTDLQEAACWHDQLLFLHA